MAGPPKRCPTCNSILFPRTVRGPEGESHDEYVCHRCERGKPGGPALGARPAASPGRPGPGVAPQRPPMRTLMGPAVSSAAVAKPQPAAAAPVESVEPALTLDTSSEPPEAAAQPAAAPAYDVTEGLDSMPPPAPSDEPEATSPSESAPAEPAAADEPDAKNAPADDASSGRAAPPPPKLPSIQLTTPATAAKPSALRPGPPPLAKLAQPLGVRAPTPMISMTRPMPQPAVSAAAQPSEPPMEIEPDPTADMKTPPPQPLPVAPAAQAPAFALPSLPPTSDAPAEALRPSAFHDARSPSTGERAMAAIAAHSAVQTATPVEARGTDDGEDLGLPRRGGGWGKVFVALVVGAALGGGGVYYAAGRGLIRVRQPRHAARSAPVVAQPSNPAGGLATAGGPAATPIAPATPAAPAVPSAPIAAAAEAPAPPTPPAAAPAPAAAAATPPAEPESPAPTKEARRGPSARDLLMEGNQSLMSGNVAGAIRSYEASLRVNSRFTGAHRALGLAQERAGNKAAAIRHLKQYLRYSPRAPDAPQVRQRITSLGGTP